MAESTEGSKEEVEKYPEHIKLKAENHKTEIIHQFLEWVREEHGHELCSVYSRGGAIDFDTITTNECDALLAEFIGVDLDKIEAEKRAMIDEMRALNERKD